MTILLKILLIELLLALRVWLEKAGLLGHENLILVDGDSGEKMDVRMIHDLLDDEEVGRAGRELHEAGEEQLGGRGEEAPGRRSREEVCQPTLILINYIRPTQPLLLCDEKIAPMIILLNPRKSLAGQRSFDQSMLHSKDWKLWNLPQLSALIC